MTTTTREMCHHQEVRFLGVRLIIAALSCSSRVLETESDSEDNEETDKFKENIKFKMEASQVSF